MALAKLVSVAGAAEGGLMDTIISNTEALIEFGGSLLDTVIQHPVLGFFFAAGFIGVGVSVVGSLIGLAHRG